MQWAAEATGHKASKTKFLGKLGSIWHIGEGTWNMFGENWKQGRLDQNLWAIRKKHTASIRYVILDPADFWMNANEILIDVQLCIE